MRPRISFRSNKHRPSGSLILLLILIPFALASLACGVSLRLPLSQLPFIPPTITPTSSLPPPTLTPTAVPTSLPTASPLPPTTTSSPTPSASPTHTPTPDPQAQADQLRLLSDLWNTVNDNYLYEDFNGLDWRGVYDDYRQQIEAGLSNQDFYLAMEEMIYRLGDDHSAYFNPEEARQDEEDFSGSFDFVGIGIFTTSVPRRKHVSIIQVFPGSPAEQAGLRARDNLLEVDGLPIVDENGFRQDRLLGEEGTSITLTVQTPGQAPRQVRLTRQRISGDLPVPYSVLSSPQGRRVGYIFLTTFNNETITRKVRHALQDMTASGPLDGLIIDNRMNEGGVSTVFEGVLSFFEDGRLGSFVSRDREESLEVDGRDIGGSQQVPLVVLVGPDTASFGEIFSGILKDTGRAFLIGQTTDGNVEILYVYGFFDGSRAWIAHDTFQPRNNPEQNWELTGIIPDLTVLSNWDEVTNETDPVIQAALDHFDQ